MTKTDLRVLNIINQVLGIETIFISQPYNDNLDGEIIELLDVGMAVFE